MFREKSEISLTPLIDIVFLLLVFFMCATQFKASEGILRTFLPRDVGSGRESAVAVPTYCRVTLAKTPQGRLLALADDQRVWTPRGLDESALEDYLRFRQGTFAAPDPGGLPVIVDFASDVPYHAVVRVLNVCRRAEIVDIRIAIPAD